MTPQPKRKIKFFKVNRSDHEIIYDDVIVEQSISISVNGSIWVTLMCTPIDLEALIVGFLFSTGVIDSYKEIKSIELHPNKHMIEVWLDKDVEKPETWLITSGCSGGIAEFNKEQTYYNKQANDGCRLQAEQIISLSKQLIEHEGLHHQVGGVHTSALSDGNEIIVLCEDIGRHNSIDKIVGKSLINDLRIEPKIILSTGRVSSDMLQKAIRVGVSILISLSSPTSLSIEMAEKAGITLVGYARGRKFNLYTHPDRIINPEKINSIKE